jgi:uncharacterized SAM-binding protein YcdF (DUF218 family)
MGEQAALYTSESILMIVDVILVHIGPFVKRLLVASAAVVPLLVVLTGGILYYRVDARAQVEAARRSDAIVVLGCAVWPGERPSPALYARVQHAVDLYKAGYASHLILTGGVGQYPPAEALVMQRLALAAGVPGEALFLDDRSHSTEENLANAKELMRAQGWQTALIVSDPFHLLRAEMIARDLGMVAVGSPASDSPTYTARNLRVWYTAREPMALVWYQGARVLGEPAWLYSILKGRL